MIPKTIHYCWFGGKPEPADVKKCIASWKKYAPDYALRRWDETNFDVTAHPFTKAAYEAGCWAFVSDYARLKLVYDHGGIYLDTDVELLKSPDALLRHEAFFATEQKDKCVATGLGFGGEKGSAAVAAMLAVYDTVTFDPEKREQLACPILNTKALRERGYVFGGDVQQLPGAAVYPPRYFDPLAPGDTQNLLCGDTYSIHHYSASWTSPGNRLKRRLFRLVGEERILKIKGWLKR